MWLFGQQPLKVHYGWSKVIAWLMGSVMGYRKEVIYTNLAWAFPEKSYAEIKQIAKQYYLRVADIIVEAIWFGGSSAERLRKQGIVRYENIDCLGEFKKAGKSVIILDSHCGNWELMGGFLNYDTGGAPFPIGRDEFYVVYKELTNKVFDKVFYSNRIHPLPGFKGIVESKGLLRHILAHRGQSSFYLINNDQYPGKRGIDVGTFLNQHTTAQGATATMANKLGLGVVFMKMQIESRGHYVISFETIAEDASLMDPAEITKRYMQCLEAQILELPYNWLWSHKRWKNK